MLTVAQVAQALHVTPDAVRKWIASGELKASKFGAQYAISEQDLQQFKSSHVSKRGRKTKEITMKTVTATLTNRNMPAVTVQLPSTPESTPLTPKLARAAARIAYGHTDGVTVMDGDTGYQLTRNSHKRIELEPSF